jgi:hypothetical protein
MAGAGYKLFQTGDVLTAAQVNTYLNEQTVMVFASSAARTSALTSVLAEGMVSYLQDTNAVEVYDGSNWVSIGSSGDITGVTAGTGLTGGGTSGDVTISLSAPVSATNGGTAQTTYTTGDLLYASASNTLSKRAIGTTGQVLTVSGGVPTWATASSGTPSFVGCFLYKSSNQSLSNDTTTVLTFTAEEIDTDGFHDNSTNTGRITIPTGKGGKYLFIGYASFAANATGSRAINFTKNGSSTIAAPTRISANSESGSDTRVNGQIIANLNAGDYVEMTGYQKSGGSLDVQGDSIDTFRTKFGCVYLGA